MKLKNPFSVDTRELFRDVQYSCWICKGNGSKCGGTELHHIKGRISSSPLNGSVLCKKCHEGMNHNDEEESMLLKKTITFLMSIRYKLTEEDTIFYKDNKKLYA